MSTPLSSQYRWQVASRVLAAALGGYALTSVATVALALLWPLPRAHAVLAATMLSFTVYTVAVIWVFSTRSVVRAWLGMVLPSGVLALACWLLWPGGGA